MQMDLIKAFDAAASEAPTSARPSDSTAFPNVLESSLASSGDERGTPSEGDADAARDGEAEEAAAGAGARSDDPSAQEDARAAAESGAPAVAAAGLAERARELAVAESERETEGRPSDLAAGDGAASEDERTDGATEADTAVARAVEGAVAAEAEAAGEEVATTARVATEQGMPTTPQVASATAEVGSRQDPGSEREDVALAQAAERASQQREQAAEQASQQREQAAQDSAFERAAADRALDEASGGTVDPMLRQQIDDRAAVQRAPDVASVDGAAAVASPVAGLVTETTTATAPGTPSPVVASEAIAVQTEWLATRGGGTARLVLHPPELGEMAIRVTLRGGAVDVVMVAQEAMAAGVADEQSERLAQAFAGRDLRLDQFEVRRGDPAGLATDSDGRFAESGSGDGREARGDEADREGRGDRGRPGARGDGSEPTPVPRIATIVADTGGVDLRI